MLEHHLCSCATMTEGYYFANERVQSASWVLPRHRTNGTVRLDKLLNNLSNKMLLMLGVIIYSLKPTAKLMHFCIKVLILNPNDISSTTFSMF